MNRMDNVIDAALESLCEQEIASAYRGLCGMMLVQTALAFRRKPCRRKDQARERRASREWVTNDSGVLTFSECCEVMGMDADTTREAMYALAEAEPKPAINRVVFGVKHYANQSDADSRGGGRHRPEPETGGLY